MTHPLQPPTPNHRPHGGGGDRRPFGQPSAPNRGRRIIWLLVAGAVLVTAVAVVLAVLFGSRTVEGSGEQAAVRVSGERSEWMAAVCAEDSVVAPGAAFPLFDEATDVEYCMTRASAVSGPQSVVIGVWPADATVANDLSRLPQARWFATGTRGDRTTAFILQSSADRSLLEPLTQFGFEISSR